MPKVSSEELSFIITPDGFLADYAVDMLSNEPNLSHHSQHWLNIFTQIRIMHFMRWVLLNRKIGFRRLCGFCIVWLLVLW